MPITWTAEMDRKLLLAILKVHDFSIDKTKVAEELNTDEQPCTGMAVQKRLQAIRNMIKNESDPDATPKVKAKATPRKRGTAPTAENDGTPTKKGKTGRGKGAKAKAAEDDEDDEADGEDGGVGAAKQEDGHGDALES